MIHLFSTSDQFHYSPVRSEGNQTRMSRKGQSGGRYIGERVGLCGESGLQGKGFV